jgi:hypothetical protein
MKYTKFYLWALLALTLCLPARAQDETPEPEEKRHWEVGIDLLPLINKETLPAASVFGCYHFTTPAGREMALRLRVGGINRTVDTTYSGPSIYFERQTTGFFLRPGWEIQKEFPKNLFAFIGVDASLGFTYRRDEGQIVQFIDPVYFNYEDRQWEYGLHGIAGMGFRVTEQITLSVESSLNFTLLRNQFNGVFAGGVSDRRFSISNLSFAPITVANLSILI